MKRNICLSGLIILIAIVMSSCLPVRKIEEPGYVIAPFSDTMSLKGGTAIYALPRTVLTFKVSMERTIELPGPYAEFAEELLSFKGVIMNEQEYWSITGISVNSHEEADPSEYYVIESNNIFHSNMLVLKKEGLIMDISTGAESFPVSNIGVKEVDLDEYKSYDLGSDEYYRVQRDTAYRRVNLDTAFIRIPYIVETKRSLTLSQLAERAAHRLMEIRDGKILILTGEANVFPQDDAAIKELNRLENEYTRLFTGKTITENRSYTCQIIPRIADIGKPITLLTFSELTGPDDSSGGSGTAITITLTPEQKTKDLTFISSQTVDPFTPVVDRLFYRVPDIVDLSVTMGDEVIYNARKMIYQFGEIIQLPGNYIIGK